MYILINHRIAINTTGSYRLEKRQTCSKLHNLLHYMLEISSTNASRYRRWHHAADRTFNEQRDSDRSLVLDASFQFVDI